MNFRLFMTIFSAVISSFLFIIGSLTLVYINATPKKSVHSFNTATPSAKSNSFLTSFIEPLKLSLDPLKVYEKAINVLLLGGDIVNKNTDTMMVMNINPGENKLSVISIPRDTRIDTDSAHYKVNASYPMGGAKKACSNIENLLDIKIEYYLYIDTKTFVYIIDTLGGIEYNVPDNMDYEDPTQDLYIHLKKGYQILDGEQSEGLMRFRQYNYHKATKYYDGSDLKRIDAQQSFMMEIIRQKANIYSISKFKDIMEIILKRLETNFTFNEIIKLINYSSNFSSNNVKMFTLPGDTEEGGSWYYIPNKDKIKATVTDNFKMAEN